MRKYSEEKHKIDWQKDIMLKIKTKIDGFLNRLIIKPNGNRKLQIFHLFVALCFYFDFFITGFILGNYQFIVFEANEYFLDINKQMLKMDTIANG